MRNLFWISIAASSVLFASERVELFGGSVDTNGTLAHVEGDPVAVYQDQIVSADEFNYDKNTSVISAKGSVNIFKARQYYMMSDYYWFNLADENHYAKPYYMFDQNSGLWMSTEEVKGCQSKLDLTDGTLSGCDSTDPLWKIRFSSADYNTDAMWVNLYNPRLEFGNIPVFYLPYLGYPTDQTRRSGLLIPYLGLSNTEGFYYQQPIYFAPHNWWDLELRPQIRTSRGAGIYADLRFVDTPSSQGTVSAGYFKEQEDYAKAYNLANVQHYGYNVNYQHAAPLREWFGVKSEGESGLYVKGSWMNDVDYLNLQHTNRMLHVVSKQIMSRVNGYYNSEDNYLGMYLKHYQYLDQPSNARTIQTLPSLQYHRYLESFLNDRLFFNADATATNFYRQDGKKAVEGNFAIPLTFQTSLLDGYLDLSYTANASAKMISFYGDLRSDEAANRYENGMYTQVDHSLSLSSMLVRPFETTTHVLNPFIAYTSVGNRQYSGYYATYKGNCNPEEADYAGIPCDYYALSKPSDMLSLGLNNYFFTDGKQQLIDRLSQNFRYDNEGSYYGELKNELEWEISSALSYYNQTAFNHDRSRITKEQNALRYNGESVTAAMSHYYTDEVRNNVPVYTSYWTADLSYQYNQNLRIFGLVAYDYQADLFKRKEIGFLHTQRCLDFGLRYVQNRRPVLTNANIDSVNESYVFITLILKPIGGSEFNYKLGKK